MTHWSCFVAASIATLATPIAVAQTDEASEEVLLVADDVFENREDNTVTAQGNVEARYQGRVLRADRIVYNRTTEKVRATGNVVILDPDGTQRFADEVEVDSNLADGYAIGFSARLPEGGTTAANAAITREDGVSALDQVIYTACEICGPDDTPTWTIRARRAVLDRPSEMFSYRDAVVEVGGVPVFYLPYFAHPDPSSGRRSGFLPPRPGASSKVGAFYQQPYYWAISPHSDLTVSPLLMSRVNPVMELDYRKRFWSGELEVNTSFTYDYVFDGDGVRANEPDFNVGDTGQVGCDVEPGSGVNRVDCDESFRSHIYAKGLFNITPVWSWGFGLERMSDDLYTRRYNINGENERRGLYNSQPRRLLSQVFLVGQDTDFYADATAFNIQGLRLNDDDARLPVGAPVFFGEQMLDLGAYGDAAVNVSGAFLTRDLGRDSRRASLGADWTRSTLTPGGAVIEPFAEARVDYYAFDEDFSPEANTTRAVGAAGVRFEYPFIRRAKSADVLVKPFGLAAWGLSNTNDPVIPNEDGLLYEFDESSLMEANGFSNYDLYEGDGKASLGFSTQVRWRNGMSVTAIAGRRWRSRSDPTLDVSSNLDGTVSDWVGGASANFGRYLKTSAKVRLDDDSLALNRIDANMSTHIGRVRLAATYYKVDEDISVIGRADEGIQIASEVKVTDRYSLVYSRLRNIEDSFDARHTFGIAYEDDCSRFEIAYERSEFQDRTIGPSESIQFRFSLKTLGDFGSSEFD
ncbi:MAG: LPS assembly protein LptD [Pseudomonadota bacterium]